ncbi:MAG TPA: DUF2752 domain-containing protein [Verrucomicrobiae bacterium]|jgi:hypothetical protein
MSSAPAAQLSAPSDAPAVQSRLFTRWFGKCTSRVAWLALILAFVLPPGGMGFSLCWLRGQFHIPCPGCGLTRSFSCAVRGKFYESWLLHPFGPFILALFFAVAMVSLLPEKKRTQLAAGMERHAHFFRTLSVVFVTAFCAYGLLRALLQLAGLCQFNA